MTSHDPIGGRPSGAGVASRPLNIGQARLVTAASPGPSLIADVVPGGFTVLAADSLMRRLVSGARHPAGPHPEEVIAADGFGLLAPVLEAAVEDPDTSLRIEIPIGDEPSWFELQVTSVRDADGCRQILVLGTDRTAEHDIEKRQRRSRRRLEAMITNAPGLVLLVDSAGRIVQTAPGTERVLGMSPRELRRRPIFELVHPDSLARTATVFNHLLGLPGETVVIDDFRLGHTDGSYRWCEARATNLLHDDDIAALVFNARDVTEQRMAEERLELAGASDALTGLPNRRRLNAHLDEAFSDAAGDATSVGLVLIDLDDFALVNDNLGHDVGDACLGTVATRLLGVAGDRGRVFRIGGDEFALAVACLTDGTLLERMASEIHDVVTQPVETAGGEVLLRAGIGTARGFPHSADGPSLLRAADLALLRAKANGGSQTVGFTAELQIHAEERLSRATELQRALHEGRLRLAYQPVVRLDGALVGAEALLRWEHDGRLLNPAEFLDLAEDTGLILPIGSWVVDQACRDLVTMREAAPDLRWVSVNLSSRQLLDERLPTMLTRTVTEHGLEAGALAVEIDAQTLQIDAHARSVLANLTRIRAMVAFDARTDDWGLLSVLHERGAHAIKLGRRFVQQLDVDPDGTARTLLLAVLDLARTDGLLVIAEGVENRSQMQVLRDLGCPLVQGYLYSEPLDLGSFLTAARAGRAPQ